MTATGPSAQPTPIAFVQWGFAIIRPRPLTVAKRPCRAAHRLDSRESLDHLIVFDEAQLRRVLKNYASYYNQVRTHLSLDKNAPDFRRPQKLGPIAAISILGGLHHQYVRV